MSYVIQAIIARPHALVGTALGQGRIVPLAQQLALLPLTRAVREALSLPFCPLTDEGARATLPPGLVEMVRTASVGGRAAYVEAELFGGAGLQACLLAEGGTGTEGPQVGPEAINVALRYLGVQRGASVDEFDALGLGRHRDTEQWEGEQDPAGA